MIAEQGSNYLIAAPPITVLSPEQFPPEVDDAITHVTASVNRQFSYEIPKSVFKVRRGEYTISVRVPDSWLSFEEGEEGKYYLKGTPGHVDTDGETVFLRAGNEYGSSKEIVVFVEVAGRSVQEVVLSVISLIGGIITVSWYLLENSTLLSSV